MLFLIYPIASESEVEIWTVIVKELKCIKLVHFLVFWDLLAPENGEELLLKRQRLVLSLENLQQKVKLAEVYRFLFQHYHHAQLKLFYLVQRTESDGLQDHLFPQNLFSLPVNQLRFFLAYFQNLRNVFHAQILTIFMWALHVKFMVVLDNLSGVDHFNRIELLFSDLKLFFCQITNFVLKEFQTFILVDQFYRLKLVWFGCLFGLFKLFGGNDLIFGGTE